MKKLGTWDRIGPLYPGMSYSGDEGPGDRIGPLYSRHVCEETRGPGIE